MAWKIENQLRAAVYLCDICKNLPALSGTQPQVPFDIPQVAAHIAGKMLDQSYRVAEPS